MLALIAAVACGGCSGEAGESASRDAASASAELPQDVTPEEIAEKMLAKYRSAKSYADSAAYVQHYVVRGDGVQRERPFFELSLAFERPNRLRLKLHESIPGATGAQSYDIASDGEQLRVAVAAMPDQLLVTPAPEEIGPNNFLPDPLLRDTLLSQSLGNVFPQLAMLLNSSDDELVFPADGPPEFLPSQAIGDRLCYRLATTSPAGQRVLWIDQEDATLRRMELPIASQEEELDPNNEYMEDSVWIEFEEPTFDADIDDDSFELAAPKDAVLVSQLTPPAPAGPPALIGRAVGETTFYDARKKAHALDDYAGRIVVLDFWQIDCPPCRGQAEKLDAVRKALAEQTDDLDEQIAFIGVNVDRDDVPATAIDKTWSSWGGSMPWLTDRDRESRQKLSIRATPTLVVLDGKSRVQLWQPGPLGDPEELQTALADLVAGKDLAAEARAAHEARLAEHRRAVEANRFKPAE